MAGASDHLFLFFIPPFLIFLPPVQQRALKDNRFGHVLRDLVNFHAGELGQPVVEKRNCRRQWQRPRALI